MSPLLAQSGHSCLHRTCPLSGESGHGLCFSGKWLELLKQIAAAKCLDHLQGSIVAEVQQQPWQPDWPRRDEIASDQGGTSTRNRVRNFASERYSSPAQCPPTHFGELPVAGRRGPPATHFQQL